MEFNSNNAASNASLDAQLWNVTFIGGTADLDEASAAHHEVASSPTPKRGAVAPVHDHGRRPRLGGEYQRWPPHDPPPDGCRHCPG